MAQMATLLTLIGCLHICSATFRLQEVFSWNAMDWNYPDIQSHEQALASGALIPENALPVGIERWNDKLFISVPRWRAGIPATLNWIPLDGAAGPSPKLNPYPDWDSNVLGDCMNGMNTVYRIKADKCDRLWVLDTGTFGIGNTTANPCPYALNVFDLKTNQRIRRYVFQPSDIVATTFIANIALDFGPRGCDDAFAYFSDELGYGLIAYSWEQNRSWRFDHNFFLPDPLKGEFRIAGLNFNWGTEGIFGIALTPPGDDGFRSLLFSPLASHTEFAVSTRVLRNESKVTIEENYNDFQVVGTRNSDGHLTARVIDDSGVQLFNLIDQNSIGCWNIARPYSPQNIAIVDRDDVGLVFPSDVKIDAEKNVWVMSDRMPVFLEAELDYSDINFRVFTAPLDVLLQGTVCETPKKQFYIPQSKTTRPALTQYTNTNTNKPYSVYDYRVVMSAPNAAPDPHEYTTSTVKPAGLNWRQSGRPTTYAQNDVYGVVPVNARQYQINQNLPQVGQPLQPLFPQNQQPVQVNKPQGYARQFMQGYTQNQQNLRGPKVTVWPQSNQNQPPQPTQNQFNQNQQFQFNQRQIAVWNQNQRPQINQNQFPQFTLSQIPQINQNQLLINQNQFPATVQNRFAGVNPNPLPQFIGNQPQGPQSYQNLPARLPGNQGPNYQHSGHLNPNQHREWQSRRIIVHENDSTRSTPQPLGYAYTTPQPINTAFVNIPKQTSVPYIASRQGDYVSSTPAPIGAWSTKAYQVEEKEK